LLVLCILVATFLPHYIHQQIDQQILETIVLDSTKAGNYRDWQDSSNPKAQTAYFNIYFFNVTNPAAVLKGAKPDLVELGPYSYREYEVRYKVNWTDNNDIMSYKTWHYFVFNEETSGKGLSENDLITSMDLALLGVHQQIMQMDSSLEERLVLRTLLCNTIGSTPFHTRPMKELFWGYKDDPVLKFAKTWVAKTISTDFPALQANATSIEDAELSTTEDIMYTGKKNISKVFQYIRYQNMSSLYACTSPLPESNNCVLFQNEWTEEQAHANGYTPIWATAEANAIFGTDGTQFSTFQKKDGQNAIFVDALMRSSYLSNTNEERVSDLFDIPMLRYRLREQDLLNSSVNAPYYMFGPVGVMNFTSIVGFPLFVTKPHFLDGGDVLVNSVNGLHPTKETHDTFIDVEPRTGISMRAAKRMQFSALLTGWDMRILGDAVGSVKEYPSCVERWILDEWKWTVNSEASEGLFLPVVWIDSISQMTEEQADEFKDGVTKWSQYADNFKTYGSAGCGVSGACCLAATGFLWRNKRRSRKSDELREKLAEAQTESGDENP